MGLEGKLDKNSNIDGPNNNKVKFEDDETPKIVPVQDNYVHQFLCSTWYGRIINIILLATLSYFIFSTSEFYRSTQIYVGGWCQLGILLLFLIVEHIIVLCILYPLSRVSRATSYYWFIGLVASLTILMLSLFDVSGKTFTGSMRFLISTEAIRMTMCIVAFLYENNKSEKIFKNSNIWTLLYFLFAPTLVYKTNYNRTDRIRPFVILYHVSWFIIIIFGLPKLLFDILYPISEIDFATDTLSQFATKIVYSAISILITYLTMVHFSYFEIFNGLCGEILRFPNRELFGHPKEFLSSTNVVRAINIVVSDFLSNYLYKPFYSMYKSRGISIFVAHFVSLFFHDLVMSYVLHVLIFPNSFMWFLPVIVLLKRKVHPIIEISRMTVGLLGFAVYLGGYIVDYFARISSIPGVENEPHLRFIPLGYLYTYQMVVKTFFP